MEINLQPVTPVTREEWALQNICDLIESYLDKLRPEQRARWVEKIVSLLTKALAAK